MNGANDPRVQKLAAAGVPWARRWVSTGWGSLRPNQKAAARSSLGMAQAPQAVQPKTTRLIKGNPSNARRSRNAPGNAAKRATFTRSEYITNIMRSTSLSGDFSHWVINPRKVKSFPKLSTDACQFEKYQITKFGIRYSPKCSEFTSGGIIIGFCSDSSDTITTKYDLMSLGCRAECSVHNGVLLTCVPDQKVRYLRDSSSDDPKLVDFGTVHVCVYGQAANDALLLGELFFEYTVVLSEPQFSQSTLQHLGVGDSILGPDYINVERVDSTPYKKLKIVCQCAGRFFVVLVGPGIDGEPNSLNITDYKAWVTTKEDSGNNVTVLSFMSEAPMSELIFKVGDDTDVKQWWATRA